MTPDNPQERLRALIAEGRQASAVVDNYEGHAYLIRRLTDALDAASRSIPAGEDAELVERLRAEEARYLRLHDYVVAERDKLRGDFAFTVLNQVKHAISGRDPVLEDAAARLSSLSSELEQVRARLKKAEEVIRPFARIADMEKRAGESESVLVNVARCRDARRWIEGGE